MQLLRNTRTLETDITTPIRDSQIKATPELYRILFDNIYTKKELAVVRELLANACDAHVAAGTTHQPIEIHLPTNLEPWFQVKDFGTGLSEENVGSLYMDFGNSDKTHTNELIGGFGVGSKAPFCLTDQFTVISRHNGTAYTFQAFIQANGAPGCAKLEETATDEPNGLSIYVPITVDYDTEYAFQSALDQLLPYLPVAPVNDAGTPLLAPESQGTEYFPDVPGCLKATFKFNHSGYGPQLHVVQGIVPYRVSEELRIATAGLDGLSRTAKKLLNSPTLDLKIHAPIGSFKLAVSRETLALTATETSQLQNLIAGVIGHIAERLTEQLLSTKTWYEGATILDLTEILIDRDQLAWSTHPGVARITLRWIDLYEAIRACDYDLNFRGVYTANKNKKGYGHENATHLAPTELPQIEIFIAPNNSYSTHRFLEQYFQTTFNCRKVAIFIGNKQELEALLTRLGIPNTVADMPQIKPHRSGYKTKLGKATYKTTTLSHNGTRWEFWKERIAINDLIDRVNDNWVFVSTAQGGTIYLEKLFQYLGHDLIKLDATKVFVNVDIPISHTKIGNALPPAFVEQGGELYEKPESRFPWNYEHINRQATALAALEAVNEALNPISLDRLYTILGSKHEDLEGDLGTLAHQAFELYMTQIAPKLSEGITTHIIHLYAIQTTIDADLVREAEQQAEEIKKQLDLLSNAAPRLYALLTREEHTYNRLLNDLSKHLHWGSLA